MALYGRAENGAGTSQGTFGLPCFAPANRGGAAAKSMKLGELFCGAGGMALGASMSAHGGWSYEHAWATDIDRDSCKTIDFSYKSLSIDGLTWVGLRPGSAGVPPA